MSFLTPSTAFEDDQQSESLALQTPMPSSSKAGAQDYMQAKDKISEKMELDSPAEVNNSSQAGFRFGFGTDDQKEESEIPIRDSDNFSQWREERRPSLASVYSSERTSYEKLPIETCVIDLLELKVIC